ncbi:hypothetical protein [Robbsia sp. KACC 23696]|uniref:hypothetical protein n=1 Tax=Robbsia sp. KACC 23696 TaxID=3149231 RepID=UPI00325B49DB
MEATTMVGWTAQQGASASMQSAVCNRSADGAAQSDAHTAGGAPVAVGNASEHDAWRQQLAVVTGALHGAIEAGRQQGWDIAAAAAPRTDVAVGALADGRRRRRASRHALAQRARLSERSISVATVATVLRQLSQCSAPFTHGSQLALDLYAAASGDDVSQEVRTVLRKCGAVLDQLSSLIPQVFYLQMVCNGFRIAADAMEGKPVVPEDGAAMMALLSQIITMRTRLLSSYLTPTAGRLAARVAASRLVAAQLASSAARGGVAGRRLMMGGRPGGGRYRVPSRATRPLRHRSDSEVAVVYPGKVIPGAPQQPPVWSTRDEVRTSVSFSRPETNAYQELGSRVSLSDFNTATRDVHAWIGMYEETGHPEHSAAGGPSASTLTPETSTSAASQTVSTALPWAGTARTAQTTMMPLTAMPDIAAASNDTLGADTASHFTMPPWFPNAVMSQEGMALLDALDAQSARSEYQIAYVNRVPVRTRWPNETLWEPIPLREYRVPNVSVAGRRQGERFTQGTSDYVAFGRFAVGVREILPGKLWAIDRRGQRGAYLPHYPLEPDGRRWKPRNATPTPALEAEGPSSECDGFIRYLNRKFIDFSDVRIDVPRSVIDDEEQIVDLAQRLEHPLPGAHKTQVLYTDAGDFLIEGEYGYYTLAYHDDTRSFFVSGSNAEGETREVPVFFDTALSRWVVAYLPHLASLEDDTDAAPREYDGFVEYEEGDAFEGQAQTGSEMPVVDSPTAAPTADLDAPSPAPSNRNASMTLQGHPSESDNVRAAHTAKLADKVWISEWSALLMQMREMPFFTSRAGRDVLRSRLYIALANTFGAMHYDLPDVARAFVNASVPARPLDDAAPPRDAGDDGAPSWHDHIAPFYPPRDRWERMSIQRQQEQLGLLLRLAYPREGGLMPLCGNGDCSVADPAFHAGLVEAERGLRDHYLEIAFVDRRTGRRHPMLLYVDEPHALASLIGGVVREQARGTEPPRLDPLAFCQYLVAHADHLLLIDIARPSQLWEFDNVTTLEGAAARLVAVLERRQLGTGLDQDFAVQVVVPPYTPAAAASGSVVERIGQRLYERVVRGPDNACSGPSCFTPPVDEGIPGNASTRAGPEALLELVGQGAALPQGVSIASIAREVAAVPNATDLPPVCAALFAALADALPRAEDPALRGAVSRLTLGALFHVDQAAREVDDGTETRVVEACGVIDAAMKRLDRDRQD